MPTDLLEPRARAPRDLFADGGGRDLLGEVEAEVTPQEQAVAERPARMTVSRGGQATLQANDSVPDERPSADWKDVVSSLPAQFVAGTRSAGANLRQMGAQESVVQREEAVRTVESDPSGWGALVRPSSVQRQQGKLEEDRRALASAAADAGQARRDIRLVTPENMTIAQEALSSLAQSSGPTLLGIAAGILTRNIPAAMAIAGGGGAGMQAGSTYGEALSHGATHREASVAASIDGLIEAGGEMLPIAYALKPGSNLYARIFGTIARESGQEAATQLAQDLRAMAMENPNLKLGEVWRNMRVAALAGAGGGAVYGGMGAAVNAAREHEAQKNARGGALVQEVVNAGSVDEAIAVAGVATQDALTPSPTPMQIAMERAMAARAHREAMEGRAVAEPAAPVVEEGPGAALAVEAERSDQGSHAVAPQAPFAVPARVQVAPDAEREASGVPEDAAIVSQQRSSEPELAHGAQTAQEAPAAPVQPSLATSVTTQPRAVAVPAGAQPEQLVSSLEAGPTSTVDQGAHQAAASPQNALPEPSAAQVLAGNAQLGHARLAGMDLSIENPAGSVREDKNNVPPQWRTDMQHHYGYIKGTVAFDKDHLDVFVKPETAQAWGGTVYVVNQNKGDGKFDEHKAMVGFSTETEARNAYLANYEKGWEKRIRSITAMPLDEFKAWAYDKTSAGPKGGPLERTAAAAEATARIPLAQLRAMAKGARNAETRELAQLELDRRALAGRSTGDRGEATLPGPQVGPATPPISPESRRTAPTPAEPRGSPPISAESPRPSPILNDRDSGDLAADDVALRKPYTGVAGDVANADRARPDAIREAVRELLGVPINEGGITNSKAAGIYKVKPQTIRVRKQHDVDVIAHEAGHHLSETNKPLRMAMQLEFAELSKITPYAESQRTRAQQQEEGFAEFIRLYLTQREVAKSRAPRFYAAFEKFLDGSKYRPIFNQLHDMIEDWQNLDPAGRILAKVGKPKVPLGEHVKRALNTDRMIFEVLDNTLPWKRMTQDLAPAGMPASKDPHIAARLLAGDAAIVEDWLLHGTVPFDPAQRADPDNYGKPLAEILKPVSGELREFGAYLVARRARQLAGRGKENLFNVDEIAAGMRLETPEFKTAAKEIYAFNDRVLDYAVEGGLLSSRSAEQFREYADYVPFFREREGGGWRSKKGNVFKRIEGGTENLRDPIGNIIENVATVIYATNRNAALSKAFALANGVPGGGRWIEEIPLPKMKIQIETKAIIDALAEQGIEINQEMAQTLAMLQTFFVPTAFGDEQSRITIVRSDGKPRALQVNDQMLWESLQAFQPIDLGIIGTMLAIPADLLRAGVVLTPDFVARNAMRDTVAGFMQSKKGLIPILGTIDGFREILTRSDTARLFRAFGGAFGDMWRGESGYAKEVTERMARRGGFDPRTIVTPRGLIDVLQRLGAISESGTRIAEFKRTMREGDIDSLFEAAYNARNVSSDFGLHGRNANIRLLTRWTPFLNPALQGLAQAGRTGKDQFFTTLLRGSILTTLTMALFLTNRDEDWYKDLERWEKNTYWHFDIGLRGENGEVIPLRVPKPWEWGGIFASVPEALTQAAIDQNGKEFAKRLKTIFEDVFALRAVPTAVLVPAELWGNRNTFTNRPIVPEHKEKLAPELQFNQGTSYTARELGKLTDLSPAKIDHTIRGVFGTMGTYATMLADQTLRSKYPEDLPTQWRRMPVIKAFVHDPSTPNSRSVTDFYLFLNEARRADASWKRFTGDEAAAYLEKHRQEIEEARSANGVAREIAALRKENEHIKESTSIPGGDRLSMMAENNRVIKGLAREYMRDISKAEVRH